MQKALKQQKKKQNKKQYQKHECTMNAIFQPHGIK